MGGQAFAIPTERSRNPGEAAVLAQMSSPFGRSPFGGFTREKDSELFMPKHDTTTKLTQLMKTWAMFELRTTGGEDYSRVYFKALAEVSGFACSAKELDAFIKVVPSGADPVSLGIFISAIINSGVGDRYTVRTERLGNMVGLGIYNQKQVVVEGSVGSFAGYHMCKGSMLIKGDAGAYVGGRMSGGSLTVIGNVEHNAGHVMGGGDLTINGDAGGLVGQGMLGGNLRIIGNVDYGAGFRMKGGTLTVHGNVGSTFGAGIKGGTIYIYGQCETIEIWGSDATIFVGGVQVYPSETLGSVHESVPEVV